MNKYNFNTRVCRKGTGSLKEKLTPENIKNAGLVCYWGAEFDFPTCPAFSKGVRACAESGLYAYTLQDEEYNQHVKWWMQNVRSWEINTDWIVPTHGTIYGLATAIRMFVHKGDQMIVLQPTYNRYEQAATRMGLKTEYSRMIYKKEGETSYYEIDWRDLEQKISNPSSKLLVICNPNNPTGTVLGKDELEKIDELSKRYNVPVYCDEIFAEVLLEGEPVIPYGKIAGEDSLSITCTSLGKCMSLTGVNHANVIIPNPKLKEAYEKQKFADHYGSVDPMLYAGLCSAYTDEGKDFVESLFCIIKENVQVIEETLKAYVPKAKVIHPSASYVLWIDYSGLGMTDESLAHFLNEEALFCGDVGNDYGADGQFYRYSIAVPLNELKKSMGYIQKAAERYGMY
jgi:cystathionine beta-lyase